MTRKIKKNKIHITKGDIIQIISGDYKGKIGKVKDIFVKKCQVIVENANAKTKHLKPKNNDEAGQIIQIEAPIHSSNVMLYSQNKKVASRYNKIIDKNNIKQRILKKTNEQI